MNEEYYEMELDRAYAAAEAAEEAIEAKFAEALAQIEQDRRFALADARREYERRRRELLAARKLAEA